MQQNTPNYEEYKERLTNFSNEFDLGLFMHILKKSLIWVFACLILAIAGAFLYLKYTPPVFKAKAILQLGQSDNATKILNVNQYPEDNDLQAKLELMRSKLLVTKALENIPLDIGYFAQGEILTNEHYTLAPYRVENLEVKDESIRSMPIYVRFQNRSTLSMSIGSQEFTGLDISETIELPFMSFDVKVLDWDRVEKGQEENPLYFVVNDAAALTNRFYSDLDVRILNNTAKTLEISFEDNNPYIAKDFTMSLAEEFIRFDLERKSQSDENIITFVDSQIDTVFDRLKSSEILLNRYKQENKVSDLEELSSVYFDRISHFEDDIIELELEEKVLNEVEDLTEDTPDEIGLYNLVPLVAGSKYEGALSGLLQSLYDLLMEKEEALYSVTKDNERIRSLEYQISIQRKLIIESIRAIRDKISNRKKELQSKVQDVEGDFYQLPGKELEFARLKRLFNINEKYYTMLLEKRIEYRISKEGFVSNNQILEIARVPRVPLFPNKNLVLLSFLFGGLVLSFIMVSVKYLFHNDITSLNEIVKLSNASISTLGVIPRYKKDIPVSMLLIDRKPKSLIAESFRNIRTNLQFIDNSPGPKVAAVTSTISGEGKTFISINLAGIIAYSGKKVVVIDLDMRKPKIHKGFGVENISGMSTLLIGQSTITDCVQKSKLENLDFITAGPIPPNPSELIISTRMDEILNDLKKEYDMIIVDTPPVGLVTDGVSMIQKADFPLYIFRADYSKKEFVQNVDRLKNENHIKHLSAILNGVDMDRTRYSYRYGYGYSYGYGYGYGQGYYDDSSRKKSIWKKYFSS